MCLIVFFFCKSMSGAWLWFDMVLFLVLSSCQKKTMVGGTSRKEKNIYTFIYVYMINGITTLRKQSQLLFFIVIIIIIIIIIIIFVYLADWGVKGKQYVWLSDYIYIYIYISTHEYNNGWSTFGPFRPIGMV